MIQISMYDEKWRMAVINELWEFDDLKVLENIMKVLLDIKNKHGRLKHEG